MKTKTTKDQSATAPAPTPTAPIQLPSQDAPETPSDVRAESQCLGLVLTGDAEEARQRYDLLTASDFYDSRNQVVFAAMARLVAQEKVIDSDGVLHILASSGQPSEVLQHLTVTLPDESRRAYNFGMSLANLRHAAETRRIVQTIGTMREILYSDDIENRGVVRALSELALAMVAAFARIAELDKEVT